MVNGKAVTILNDNSFGANALAGEQKLTWK